VLKPQHLSAAYLCISDECWQYWYPKNLHYATIFTEEDYKTFTSQVEWYGLQDITFIKQPIILQELLYSDAK
jgi:hypothetical protein